MKKVFCVLTVLVLMTGLFACAEEATDPVITSVAEWLETKGECLPSLMKVTVLEIINPVLALVGDETGTVNLFGVTVDGEFTDFLTLDLQVGEVLLLEKPVYNEYEGSVEMADSVLAERIPAEQVHALSFDGTTWSMMAHYRDGAAVDIEPGSLMLNADGTGHLVSNVQDYDLSWTMEGNQIVLNVQGQTMRLNVCLVWAEENTVQMFSEAE